VTGHKKKIVAFLAAVALGSSALVAYSSKQDTGKSASETPGLRARNSESETGLLFRDAPAFPGRSGENVDTGEMFFKMMVLVLLVFALGAAAIYVSKRFLPRIANLPGKRIRIIETAHLGHRRTVHLVEIGGRRLLIGSTNENITTLADVTDALCETDSSAPERSARTPFVPFMDAAK
jgi:flagellar biosynthetic protein FliO